MNYLIEKNYISELKCGLNFSYIINDSSTFVVTEYKVLHSQANSCFVKCMKMLYNGKIQLYYVTKFLKPLASMIPSLDPDSFCTIVANLFSDILDVKYNGFLSCQNIDISFEHIYVDTTTYKVSLVYLPINKRMYDSIASFENEVRTGLVKLISGVSTLLSTKTMQLSADLSNGTLSLEDLYNRVKGGTGTSSKFVSPDKHRNTEKEETMHLVAMNAPARVDIIVSKDNFVIGKKAEVCDGVISFNKMISRSHCRINKQSNHYSVTDLQSANGTYVNGIRVQPNQSYPINNGDIIRLANTDFQVVIE